MLKLKQYLCKHDFELIAKHNTTNQNLWKCKKCGVYYIQHYGLEIGYKCKIPNLNGFIEIKKIKK